MRYRLLDATGAQIDSGECSAGFAGGAFTVTPVTGAVLRITPVDIVRIAEPEPYTVALHLAEGATLELTRIGVLRTQLLAELADARQRDVPAALVLDGIGTPEAFTATVNGQPARLLLYDDALVPVPDNADPDKIPYPFLRSVDVDGYRLRLDIVGGEPLDIGGLARRTHEFVDLVRTRVGLSAGRTAHFLAALLPGLGPIALRSLGARLRDGLAAARTDLDAIDPTVFTALLDKVTRPDRRAGAVLLSGLGDCWIGVKQQTSVHLAADVDANADADAGSGAGSGSGVGGGWRDPAIQPNRDHGGAGDSLAGMLRASLLADGPPVGFGAAGMPGSPLGPGVGFGAGAGAGLGFDAPFGALGTALAYQMLGVGVFGAGGLGAGGPGAGGLGVGGLGVGGDSGKPTGQLSRPDMSRGFARPESTDYEALSGGTEGQPVVLAFLFCRTASGHLIYEVLNAADHASYVYQARDDSDVAAINRALDLLGFRVAGVIDDVSSAGSRYRKVVDRVPALRGLRDAFLTRVVHGDSWPDRLRAALATSPGPPNA